MEPSIIEPRKKGVAIIYKIIGVIVFVLAGFLLLSIHGILLLGLPVQVVFTIVIFSIVLFILGFGLFTLQKWIIPLIIILPFFALIRGSSINAEQIIVQILLLAVGFWGWKNKNSFKGKFFHPVYSSAIFLVLIVGIILQFTGTPITSVLNNLNKNSGVAVKSDVATSTQSVSLSKITDESILSFLAEDGKGKSTVKPLFILKNGSYTIDFGQEGTTNITKIIKADLNNDGREDAIVLYQGCGASCSDGVDVLLNKVNGIVRADDSDFPLFAKGIDVSVQNSFISVDLKNLAGEIESSKIFKVQNDALVQVTQSTSVNADWKTYTNAKYSFSFQYPTSFGELTTLKDDSLAFGQNGNAQMVVYMPKVFINSANGQPETFNDLMSSYDVKGYTKTTITVGGIKSVIVSSPQIGDLVFVPLTNNKILEIAGSMKKPTFNQIISTFSF